MVVDVGIICYCCCYVTQGKDVCANLETQKAFLDALTSQISESEDADLVQVKSLMAKLSNLQSNFNEANCENKQLSCTASGLEEQINEVSSLVKQLKEDDTQDSNVYENLETQKSLTEALACQMSDSVECWRNYRRSL